MSSVQEGLGTAVLDAMALGKPVVATKSGGIPEIITDGQTGRLVAAGNPEALARGIMEMLTNTDSAKRMTARGQEMVRQNFSVEAMVAGTIEVYKNLLNV
jgi:glycosyltransferase involved in cell wall biosynthesis